MRTLSHVPRIWSTAMLLSPPRLEVKLLLIRLVFLVLIILVFDEKWL